MMASKFDIVWMFNEYVYYANNIIIQMTSLDLYDELMRVLHNQQRTLLKLNYPLLEIQINQPTPEQTSFRLKCATANDWSYKFETTTTTSGISKTNLSTTLALRSRQVICISLRSVPSHQSKVWLKFLIRQTTPNQPNTNRKISWPG